MKINKLVKRKNEKIEYKLKMVEKCPYCGSGMHLATSKEVYGENTPSPDDMFFACDNFPSCNVYIMAKKSLKRINKRDKMDRDALLEKIRNEGLYNEYVVMKKGHENAIYKIKYVPTGLPADRYLRNIRIEAHFYMKQVTYCIPHLNGEKDAIYEYLRQQMGMSKLQCHISLMYDYQVEMVIRYLIQYIEKYGTRPMRMFKGGFSEKDNKLREEIERYNKEKGAA